MAEAGGRGGTLGRAAWTLALLLAVSAAARAQPLPPDSLPAYRRPLDTMRVELGEVVVGTEAAAAPAGPGAVRVGNAALAAVPTASLADVAPLLPGATVQTNSRGETLVYLRGAGERQTLLLLDGAPLAIPWDRRIDLALVPALALGDVEAVAGPAAMTAGPDALGGAVRFRTRRLGTDGLFAEADAWGRLPAAGQLGAIGLGRRGPFGWAVAGQGGGVRGEPVAGGADLPFSQPADALRTNTDRRRASTLVRLDWTRAAWRGAVTVLGATDASGVAPESHLDPARERVRYWRLPARRYGLAVLNLERARTDGLTLGATAWAGGFGQTIAQFPTAAYDGLALEQHDRDAWAGARLRAERPTPVGRFALTGRGQFARHREREREPGETAPPFDRYGQVDAGALADWRHRVGRAELRLGARYDRLALLETGGKPGRDPFGAASAFGSVEASVGGGWRLHAAAGRAARFPTLRELFGVALGRFAESPDLEAERAWTGEVGAERSAARWQARLVGFGRRTTDAIEQETLADGRRRRINLGGTYAVGLESVGAVRIGRAGRVTGHLTLQHLRDDSGARLPEKPSAIARATAGWAPPLGPNARLEGRWSGGAVGPDAAGALVDLASAPRVAVRVGYRARLAGAVADAFVRGENVTDAAFEPQLGLPAPGRSVQLGLRLLWGR